MNATPSQTVGPFFRFGLSVGVPHDAVPPGTPGSVVVSGRVLDGAANAVPDAVVELWQADADGRLSPGLFARALTDDSGHYSLTTVIPGRVDEEQAPHADVSVFARGLLQRLVTRLYFPQHGDLHDADPFLGSVPEGRRHTIIAVASDSGFRFDIHLQGDQETVFCAW
jgi:protocatechuate 3,4-dioxygenase alpha subunit